MVRKKSGTSNPRTRSATGASGSNSEGTGTWRCCICSWTSGYPGFGRIPNMKILPLTWLKTYGSLNIVVVGRCSWPSHVWNWQNLPPCISRPHAAGQCRIGRTGRGTNLGPSRRLPDNGSRSKITGSNGFAALLFTFTILTPKCEKSEHWNWSIPPPSSHGGCHAIECPVAPHESSWRRPGLQMGWWSLPHSPGRQVKLKFVK